MAPRGVLPHVGYFSCCEQHTQDPTHAASLLTALNPLSPPYISLSLSLLICSLLINIRMSLHIISYLSLVLVISHDLRERAADSLPLKCLCAHRSCRGARPPRDPRPLCIRSHGCCRPPSTRDHPTRHASFYKCFPCTYTSHCTLFKFDRHRGLFKFYARLPPDICRRVQRPAAPWLQAQYQARREPGKRPSRCISSCFFSLPTHTAFSVFGLAQIAAICMLCPHDPQAIVYSPFLDEQAIIRGADEDGTPWKVTGKVSGSEMIVDFSPKGGPKAVPAKWNGLGIQFPGLSPPPLLREPYPPPAHPHGPPGHHAGMPAAQRRQKPTKMPVVTKNSQPQGPSGKKVLAPATNCKNWPGTLVGMP